MNRTHIRRIAASYWVRLLMLKTGESAKGLERLLIPGKGEAGVDYSNRFQKYLQRKASPHPDFVVKVEQHPETRDTMWVFNHPLWRALLCNELNISETHTLMSELSTPVYNRLFRKPKCHKPLQRRCLKSTIQIFNLSKISDWDALAALLLIIRETEIQQQAGLYTDAKWEITHLLCRLAIDKTFNTIVSPLYDFIHSQFILKNSPLPAHYKWNAEYANKTGSEYPPIYTHPPKVDIILAANFCMNQILLAERGGYIKNNDTQQYLWENHWLVKRLLITHYWSVENSSPSTAHQNHRSFTGGQHDQLHQYMQLHAPPPTDHRTDDN